MDVRAQLLEDEAAQAARDVASRGDRGLHDEHVGAGVNGDGRQLFRVGGCAGDGACDAALLDRTDAPADELLANGGCIQLLDDRRRRALFGLDDLRDRRAGVFVAALEAFQIHHRQAAALAHLHREARVAHGVQGGSQNRHLQRELAQREADVRKLRIDGDGAGDDGHLVEPVGGSEFPMS